MEAQDFKHHSFIKKIPNADRPSYITNKLKRLGSKYTATDYTSFEALFTQELMTACEFVVYEHLVSKCGTAQEVLQIMRAAMLHFNVCEFKNFTAYVLAKRMSGEMVTSLGNGITNLLVFFFLAARSGCTEVDGVVEGDDGLFVFKGKPLTASAFEELGLLIKLETWDELALASFCGIVFDTEELINVTDVRKAIANFGWTDSRYANARNTTLRMLLRAKSYSMIYQFPGCPILQELGHAGLRLTADLSLRESVKKASQNDSVYERLHKYGDLSIPERVEPGPKTRLLVETLYGVTVEQQLKAEEYLASMKKIAPLPQFFTFPKVWEDCWNSYSCTITHSMLAPALWPARRGFAVTAPVRQIWRSEGR
jgi:hypothetical protein